jgi:uncharacterized membrane protein YeaQ/YmgE (transglycosylase-associated protein family)
MPIHPRSMQATGLFGATGITGFDVYSLIVAVIGSIVVLWGYHIVTGRRTV